MEENQTYQKDIASIRQLMERSAKFISLSGLSGIMTGIYALAGAGAAKYLMDTSFSGDNYDGAASDDLVIRLGLIAFLVLTASLVTGCWLTLRNSKRLGANIWDATGKRFLINLAIPLVTGGIFILALLAQSHGDMVGPACLIFYGLALINASPNVYEEVRYLGYSEIFFGLIAAAFPGYGLMFWAIGFGILHILYGAIMYRKYDA